MKNEKMEEFQVIGIAVRTTNENGQGKKDIEALWAKLMSENSSSKIPNIIEQAIYSVYTDYESDYTKPYTTILGYKVASLDSIPEGMVGIKIEPANYIKFTAKGDLSEGVVVKTWDKIWGQELNRAYLSDFEVYGEKAANPKDAEVDIYISVK